MNPSSRHLLEKWQVRIAAAVALAVAWFACWQLVSPRDTQGVMAFLPDGQYGRLSTYAGLVWAISFGCALLTLSAPPEGALLAALVGAIGLSLRGGPMRALLWRWQSDPGRLFSLLAAELVVLGGVLAGAMIVIALVRSAARRIRPGWVWSEPASGEVEAPPAPAAPAAAQRPFRSWLQNTLDLLRGRSRGGKATALHALGCLVMELALAVILLVFTFRSTDRGQIAFALAASFFVGALVAGHVFPVGSAVPIWLGPIIMGTVVLILGGTAGAASGLIWRDALIVARGIPLRAALPVDWMVWGGGGAVAGFWMSRRLHFASRAGEEKEAQKEKA